MELETLRSGLRLVWKLRKRGVQGQVGDQGGDKGNQEKRSVIITGFSVN